MLGYFGPAGTFTHQALQSLGFDEPATAYATVPAALEAVRDGHVRACLVPIENSVEGGVSATLDNLAQGRPLVIVGEVLLAVQFGLYVRPGTPLTAVRRVLTHPHAAAQTRGWLAANLPGAEVTGAVPRRPPRPRWPARGPPSAPPSARPSPARCTASTRRRPRSPTIPAP